jgi:hypothetical protein
MEERSPRKPLAAKRRLSKAQRAAHHYPRLPEDPIADPEGWSRASCL